MFLEVFVQDFILPSVFHAITMFSHFCLYKNLQKHTYMPYILYSTSCLTFAIVFVLLWVPAQCKKRKEGQARINKTIAKIEQMLIIYIMSSIYDKTTIQKKRPTIMHSMSTQLLAIMIKNYAGRK